MSALADLVRKALKAMARAMFFLWRPVRLLRIPLSKAANLVPPGQDFIFTRYLGGMSVLIDHRIFIETQVTHGGYELAIVRKIEASLRHGDRCIDVGANVGLLTLPMARAVGSMGEVWAVEPGRGLCKRLQKNLDLNPRLRDRVTVYNVGLSDRRGWMRWIECANQPGNATLEEMTQQDTNEGAVAVEMLDNLVDRERVDFIKIDVEGMELAVLRGAKDTLTRCRPLIVFETLQEFRFRKEVDTFRGIADLLESMQYRFACLDSDNRLVERGPDAWRHMTWAFNDAHLQRINLI